MSQLRTFTRRETRKALATCGVVVAHVGTFCHRPKTVTYGRTFECTIKIAKLSKIGVEPPLRRRVTKCAQSGGRCQVHRGQIMHN